MGHMEGCTEGRMNVLQRKLHSQNWIKASRGGLTVTYIKTTQLHGSEERCVLHRCWIKERGGLQYKSALSPGCTHFTDNKKIKNKTYTLTCWENTSTWKPGGIGLNRSSILTLGQNKEETSLPDTFYSNRKWPCANIISVEIYQCWNHCAMRRL